MSFPEPEQGLVIRYSYLWKREHDQGYEDGQKDRPCAVELINVKNRNHAISTKTGIFNQQAIL